MGNELIFCRRTCFDDALCIDVGSSGLGLHGLEASEVSERLIFIQSAKFSSMKNVIKMINSDRLWIHFCLTLNLDEGGGGILFSPEHTRVEILRVKEGEHNIYKLQKWN